MTDSSELDLAGLHRRAAEVFGSRARAIRDDQWTGATPCEDWDVRALVHHVVEEERWIPYLVEGMTIEEVGDRLSGDLLGDDPKAAWDAAGARGAEALEQEGVMDRTIHLSFGDVAGVEYASQIFADVLIHGWDLARAIGADERLDPELVEACWEIWAPREDELRSAGAFGDKVEVPEDADRQAQLLALYGRDSRR